MHSTAKDKVLSKPLPFITKTNLYDEHWATKQERGMFTLVCMDMFTVLYSTYMHVHILFSLLVFLLFLGFTKWLNFILAPTDQYGNIITPQGKTGSTVCSDLLSHGTV